MPTPADNAVVPCPMCGATEYENTYQTDFTVWTQGDRLWTAHQVVCKGCGLIYTNPRPTEAVLQDFYDTYLRFGEISSHFRDKQIAFLCNNLPSTGGTL